MKNTIPWVAVGLLGGFIVGAVIVALTEAVPRAISVYYPSAIPLILMVGVAYYVLSPLWKNKS